jgi:hypothetical protein
MQEEENIVFSNDLIKLLPKMQYWMMRENPKVYADEINRMNEIVAKIPRLYETDDKPVHPLSLHYFVGGCDWYIAEWDRQDSFFGYAILNGDYDNSEWGYINRPEILDLEFPQEGDYLISPCGPLGIWTKVTVMGDYNTCEVFDGEDQDDRARAWIRNRIKQEDFYPNAWMMSDHGNLTLTTIEGVA